MDSLLPITTIALAALVALVALMALGGERQRRQYHEALALATTAFDQRDGLQRELRRAAVATAALLDLVSLHYPWDATAREQAQVAMAMWLANPQDPAARATLEAAGIPVAWLDGAAPILAPDEVTVP